MYQSDKASIPQPRRIEQIVSGSARIRHGPASANDVLHEGGKAIRHAFVLVWQIGEEALDEQRSPPFLVTIGAGRQEAQQDILPENRPAQSFHHGSPGDPVNIVLLEYELPQ